MPVNVDSCGENGEFHTVVSAGPMFNAPLALAPGEVVERDGFLFADFRLPAATSVAEMDIIGPSEGRYAG